MKEGAKVSQVHLLAASPDFQAVDFQAVDFQALDFQAVDFQAVDFQALDPGLSRMDPTGRPATNIPIRSKSPWGPQNVNESYLTFPFRHYRSRSGG